MKIPLSWLAEYVPLSIPVAEFVERLTLAGLEVSSVPAYWCRRLRKVCASPRHTAFPQRGFGGWTQGPAVDSVIVVQWDGLVIC